MSKTIRFSVSIEEDLIEAFDSLRRRRGWTNRSEAIRDAIRRQLIEHEWEAGEEVDAVISTTHVHIDEENCLEFLAVRGEARTIERLAHRLIGLKGVKHGELTGTSTGKRIR